MSTSEISAGSIQTDYMKLLITQLQNQNPLEPMDNNQMTAQLTQLSQLNQLESMGRGIESLKLSFADVVAASNRNYANSLLNRNISFSDIDPITGISTTKSGIVGEVFEDEQNNLSFSVDRYSLDIEDVADSLVGKEISYYGKTGNGERVINSGVVNAVKSDIFGNKSLIINGHKIEWEDIDTGSLVGQSVSFNVTDDLTGELENKSSFIKAVSTAPNGDMIVTVARSVNLEDVISVSN